MADTEGQPMRGEVIPALGRAVPAPTAEDIAAGRVGNGVFQRATPEQMEAHRETVRRNAIERKSKRQAAYEERVKEEYALIGDVEARIIALGDRVLRKLESVEDADELKVSKDDLAVLKAVAQVGKEMKDRGMGKSVARTESVQTGGILHLFANLKDHGA